MARKNLDEENFMQLLDLEKPTHVFWSSWTIFGTIYTFWFFGKDRIRNRFKTKCDYCFERIMDAIEKKGIKVLEADLV